MIWANNRLRLILTSECNLNCFYCHNEGQPKGNNFISESLFTRVLDLTNLTETKLKAITFTGGEALLHPRLEYFIENASKRSLKTSVVTNGLLLNRQKLRSCISAGVSKFRIGVDSLKKSSRPSIGDKPAFKIRNVIELLLSEKVDFELNIVLTKYNVKELTQLISFCKNNRISAKFFEHVTVNSFGNSHSKAQIKSEPLVSFNTFNDAFYSVVQDVTSEYSNDLGRANIIYRCKGFHIRYCHYLCDYKLCYMTGTRIDSAGSVYVCMSKRGFYKISSEEPISQSLSTIKLAVKDGCLPAEV